MNTKTTYCQFCGSRAGRRTRALVSEQRRHHRPPVTRFTGWLRRCAQTESEKGNLWLAMQLDLLADWLEKRRNTR